LDFISKSPRPAQSSSGKCLIEVPRYRGANPRAGDRVFLWFSETKGGEGLAGIATVEAVRDGNPVTLGLVVSNATPMRPLSKAMLKPFRDSGEDEPQGGLAAKLYRHSLDKVARLSGSEAEFLKTFFMGPSSSEPAVHASRYDPLGKYLEQQDGDEFVVPFSEIENALGFKLPESAMRPQWWANTRRKHANVQREAWRRAGYDAFLISGEDRVRFRKVR
jgi:hypothetical protein